MSDARQGETPTGERESYTSPELTRHGNLGELTQGGGPKPTDEKSSGVGS
jgi:hypothetical protein